MTAKTPPTVVITGASAGVGRAVVRRFARDKARIALIARGVDGLNATAREVEAAGGEALILPLDVSDAAAVEQAAQATEDRFGPIDGSGLVHDRPLQDCQGRFQGGADGL